MRYAVFDNKKPASSYAFPELKSSGWSTHIFDTFDEANDYLNRWLGLYENGIINLEPNIPFDYNGYGDIVEIKEVE